MQTHELTATALFAALTAVCAQLILPLPWGVPLSLGTLAVFFAVGCLPTRAAVRSQLIYLALGAIGLPVFSGFQGGLGHLLGPTGGYLLGYAATAWLAGSLLDRLPSTLPYRIPFALLSGSLLCYLLGTIWFILYTTTPFSTAFLLCVLPYLPGDAAKIALAILLFPRMTSRK